MSMITQIMTLKLAAKFIKEHQDLNDPDLSASSAPEQPGSSES